MRWSLFACAPTMIVASCVVGLGPISADGPDTYATYLSISPGRDLLKEEKLARTEAEEFCQKKNRRFRLVMAEERCTWGLCSSLRPTGYSVTFRCLPPEDPAIEQPTP